ncbi:MAG: tetratricopeptide repeat protein [Gammaproteobacteria bacterium]|nr:tetratricopeptide repeat protein [Gammaproteobacteria bacterium]
MDEYLSEKEQLEKIREWWRENGWYLVGGAALGAVVLFGWGQYREYTESRAEQAASLYLDLQDVLEDDDQVAAEALLTELREEHPSSPYTDQAALLLAREYLATEPDRAAEELRYVMENSQDRELSLIARLRLARVLMYQDDHEQALALLDVEDLGPMQAQFSEARGDAHVALGDSEAAREAYSNALNASGAEWLNRNFVEMKIGALPPADGGEGPGA